MGAAAISPCSKWILSNHFPNKVQHPEKHVLLGVL